MISLAGHRLLVLVKEVKLKATLRQKDIFAV